MISGDFPWERGVPGQHGNRCRARECSVMQEELGWDHHLPHYEYCEEFPCPLHTVLKGSMRKSPLLEFNPQVAGFYIYMYMQCHFVWRWERYSRKQDCGEGDVQVATCTCMSWATRLTLLELYPVSPQIALTLQQTGYALAPAVKRPAHAPGISVVGMLHLPMRAYIPSAQTTYTSLHLPFTLPYMYM